MSFPDLHQFRDIHSHSVIAPNVVTSVSPDYEISAEQGSGWFSVGIHPWDTDCPVDGGTWARLEKMAEDDRVVAIGECGLDSLRGGDEKIQEEIFIRQVRLAEKVGKPLIIHCVRRFGRLLELRAQNRAGQWIVHGFRGKPELARQLAAAGIAISLGATTSREKYAAVPDEMIYRETDR